MLQNHPGERDHPVKPDAIWHAFECMSRGQEILGRFLVLVAVLAGGIALIAWGILSDSTAPPRSGFVLVAALAAITAACVVGLVVLGRRATWTRVNEQMAYYRKGRCEVPIEQVHREALQLDGVNAATGWTETLESWPAEVRFPDGAPTFRTFSLLPREEAREQLDNDWGVLTTAGYRDTVNALFAGLHSREFLALVRNPRGAGVIERVAALVDLPAEVVAATLDDASGPAPLLWGWDLWRVIPLSRNAFMAGLATEQEAWANILRASAMIHALFTDLEAYHQNLRIGHAFWCSDYAQTRARRERLDAFMRQDPSRPIRDLPWTRRGPDCLPPVLSGAVVGVDEDDDEEEDPGPAALLN